MPDQEETIPVAGPGTDGDLKPDFTLEQLENELRRLWKKKHANKQPDEFTISDYARTNGICHESARKDIRKMEKSGEVERVTERRQEGRHVIEVYRIIGGA